MALKQVFFFFFFFLKYGRGREQGRKTGCMEVGDNDLFRAPVLFYYLNRSAVMWYLGRRWLSSLPSFSFPPSLSFPPSFSPLYSSLTFPQAFIFPSSVRLHLFLHLLSLSPFLSLPVERRVSLEYELDYSSVPPPPTTTPRPTTTPSNRWFGFRQASHRRRLRMKTCQK